MFEKLKNRYTIKGKVVMDTGLHIGSGEDSFETDALVIKDAYGKPYIPGSSFKGILRSTVERIVPNLDGFRTCALVKNADVFSIDAGLKDDLNKNNVSENLETAFETNRFPLSNEVTITKMNESKWMIIDKGKGEIYIAQEEDKKLSIKPLCDTCKLFGSLDIASKIKIPDLYVSEPWIESFEIRDGVSIDRDTETAAEGAKFDYEVVPSQTEFDFVMICENLDERDKGILAIGLQEMQSGMVSIGGNKSRGLGAFHLEMEKKVAYLDFENEESLRKYITSHKPDEKEIAEFFEEGLKTFLKGGEDDA